jgi:hypothetical protein
MKKSPVPSPASHPNTYVGFSTGTAAALLIYEAHTRFGVDLTELEAGALVSAVVSLALLVGKRRSSN